MRRSKAKLFGGIALVLIFCGAIVFAHFAPEDGARPGDIYSAYIIFAAMIMFGVWLIIGYFRKKDEKPDDNSGIPDKSERHDWYDGPVNPFGGLSEMAAILTNGNHQAVSKMELLGRDHKAFIAAHPQWWAKMEYDTETFNPNTDMVDVFAMWLCAYYIGADNMSKDGPTLAFGAYMDWKADSVDFIVGLDVISKNLGYDPGIDEIAFGGNELIDNMLRVVNDHFSGKGYELVDLDIGNDSYQLFIIKTGDGARLMELAEDIGFDFVTY